MKYSERKISQCILPFRALKSRTENIQWVFLTNNNLNSGQNIEISDTNHILPKCFQGIF